MVQKPNRGPMLGGNALHAVGGNMEPPDPLIILGLLYKFFHTRIFILVKAMGIRLTAMVHSGINRLSYDYSGHGIHGLGKAKTQLRGLGSKNLV